MYSEGLVFCPSEIDMSIRRGWFYHPEEEPHSLERLFNTYLRSVGANTTFNLNIPPMPNGRFDPRDVERLRELGEKIRSTFAVNLCEGAKITCTHTSPTQSEYLVELGEVKKINYFELRENIANGQRIASFRIIGRKDGLWETSYENYTTVGNRKICVQESECDAFKIVITASRGRAELDTIAAY